MAVDAFVGRLFVNYHLFIFNQFGLDVALVAGNISVPAGQW